MILKKDRAWGLILLWFYIIFHSFQIAEKKRNHKEEIAIGKIKISRLLQVSIVKIFKWELLTIDNQETTLKLLEIAA